MVTQNQNNADTEDYLKISLVNQNVLTRKKARCPLEKIPLSEVNYKNLKLLNKFLTERGKILSRRITGVSVKKQRALAKAVKIARKVALISPVGKS